MSITRHREHARAAFRDARDDAMRGERLAAEGELTGAYASITAAIGALERANDELERLEQAQEDPRPRPQGGESP